MVSASMLSHRRSPTAAGKPSFAYFKVDYRTRDVWAALTRPLTWTSVSPRCNVVQKIRDIVRMLRILGNWYVQLLSAEMDSFHIIRMSKQIWPPKCPISYRSSPARKRKPLEYSTWLATDSTGHTDLGFDSLPTATQRKKILGYSLYLFSYVRRPFKRH